MKENSNFILLENILDKLINNTDQSSYTKDYPCNVIYHYQKTASTSKVVAIELQYALAGFTKDEIDISMCDNILHITARSNNASPISKFNVRKDVTADYNVKGIARRDLDIKFKLFSIDEAKIESSFTDGLLSIYLPAVNHTPNKQKIKIS